MKAMTYLKPSYMMSSSKVSTKPIINNINKSNCLKQKCELIIEKNDDNFETCIEYKIDSKVVRNEETESVGKKIHVRNLHQRNQQTFTKFTWETSTREINKLSRNSREKPPPEKSTNFHEIHVRNLHRRNQQTFTKFREIFTIVKMIIMKKMN